MTAQAPEVESANNGQPVKSKLSQLLPGSAPDADERDETIELLTPDGESIGVFVVFGFLDGATRSEYHRTAERNARRGKANYDMAVKWLFDKKCKRIEGLDKDIDCKGMEPKVFFIKDKDGNTLMNIAVNEYLQRQIGSAADSSKSR